MKQDVSDFFEIDSMSQHIKRSITNETFKIMYKGNLFFPILEKNSLCHSKFIQFSLLIIPVT